MQKYTKYSITTKLFFYQYKKVAIFANILVREMATKGTKMVFFYTAVSTEW